MKTGRVLCTAVICALCSIGAFAQTESPLKEATLGLFGAESDNVVSTAGWSGVFFDKVFVTGSYGYIQKQNASGVAGNILNANVLNAAAMFKAGRAKVGVSYTGGLGNDIVLQDDEQGTASAKQNTMPFFHNVRVLVGLPGNMFGLRLGMDIGGSYETTRLSPNVENSSNKNSLSFKPSVAFGASLRTASRYTFTPAAEVSLSVTNGGGAAAAAFWSESVGPGTGSDGKTYQKTAVYRAYTPAAEVGIGIGFPSKFGIVSWNANFKYNFSMTIMPEKYKRYVTGGVMTEAVYRPDEAMSHSFQAEVTAKSVVSWRLTVRGGAAVDLSYGYNLLGGSRTNTIAGNSSIQTEEAHRFSVTPKVTAAAVYKITDQVSWFGGIGFRPVGYTWTREHSYNEGVDVGNETKETVQTFQKPLLTHLGTGLQFTPASELSVFCAFVLQPDETSPVRTLMEAFNGNLRLGVTWKDTPKE